ncbi:MAG: hypothetical protein HUJ76_01060 [Parasporobacterium sp.]|nr:hypothetical protein [Parasporobacterium sp.]
MMNRNIIKKILVCAVALCMIVSLAACGGSGSAKGQVSDLSFNFTTGDYSFSGNKDAESYRVRIFAVEDGKDAELPVNESNDLRGGKESYSNNIPMWSLTPGETYHVYVMSKTSDGKTVNSPAAEGVYVAVYDTPADFTAEIDGKTITVDIGTVAGTGYESKADYEVTLYKDNEVIDTKVLKSDEVKSDEEENEAGGEEGDSGSAGGSSGGASYDATVEFTVDDPAAEYSATVKIISNSDIYVDSEVSEPVAVTAKQAEEPADEAEGTSEGDEAAAEGASEGDEAAAEGASDGADSEAESATTQPTDK